MDINTKYSYNNIPTSNIAIGKNHEHDIFIKELQKKLEDGKTDLKDSYIKEEVSQYWDNLKYGVYHNNCNKSLESEKKLMKEEKEIIQEEETKSETKSDIIVKPDGSRVLVMTLQIGGMASTVSVEISKPTDFPNMASDLEQNSSLAESEETAEDMSNILEMSSDGI